MSALVMGMIYFADGIGQQFTGVATGGPIMLEPLAATPTGPVSFASPCVIPLMPGYVSYLTGISRMSGVWDNGMTTGVADVTSVDKHDSDGGRGRRSSTVRVGLATLLFVLSFTVAFVLGSVSIFGLVSTLRSQAHMLTVVDDMMAIVMGFAFISMVPALRKDTHMAPKRWTARLETPLPGAVFALGWTPYLDPTLTMIISVPIDTQDMTTARGVTLTITYCLGLGLPLTLVALGSARVTHGADFLRKHSRTIQIIGGVTLALVGIALVTGL